jgi:hypothetical protein
MRIEGEGGAPASQGSFAEHEAHQLQHTLLGVIPGAGLLAGDTRAGGGRGYPGGPDGYPQAGGLQRDDFPGPPEFSGRPIGGGHQYDGRLHDGRLHDGRQHDGRRHGEHHHEHRHEHHHSGHQHGGGRYEPTSIYAPPATAPTFPMSGGASPSPYSAPSFPGAGRDGGFSFPGGDGVPFPDSRGSSSFPGGPPPSFPDGGYLPPPGPPPHVGGYNAPPGPPPFSGSGYNAPPGPPPHVSGGYHAPPGPPPGFPGVDTRSSAPPEFPGTNNPYPYGGGGGGW